MEDNVEHEVCSNCKKDIPHYNYVMHTAHCQRNIVLCGGCRKPIPKNKADEHRKTCGVKTVRSSTTTKVDPATTTKPIKKPAATIKKQPAAPPPPPPPPKDVLIACKFCELELTRRDLEEHVVYCGSRTERCDECGELVMIKYQQLHEDSNHGFLKLKDEPGPVPSWEQPKARPTRQPVVPVYSYAMPSQQPLPPPRPPKAKHDSTSEMVRRVDCKTEYIRNLLHETAFQAVPMRTTSTGAVPRSHHHHKKGQAPLPPVRRPMPPTEITIPCEFCNEPIPADDLVQHETGCRPDLARYLPKNKSLALNVRDRPESPPFDQAATPPASPEVELPCEFCSSLIPASKLLRHQVSCD